MGGAPPFGGPEIDLFSVAGSDSRIRVHPIIDADVSAAAVMNGRGERRAQIFMENLHIMDNTIKQS